MTCFELGNRDHLSYYAISFIGVKEQKGSSHLKGLLWVPCKQEMRIPTNEHIHSWGHCNQT